MKIYKDLFNKIISLDNLFNSWDEFKIDKRNKPDVLKFEWQLERNIFDLHDALRNKCYHHSPYSTFYIQDPKQRRISKARVCDRILHHAIFTILNPLFEPTFISHSFSCRVNKGTHKGVQALAKFLRKESRNNTRECYALKCDVQKFFNSVNHKILIEILCKKIKDKNTIWLLEEIISSYSSEKSDIFNQRGIPIGNLTSQMFANVYMNELDLFVKQKLKVKNYVRYTDDFIIVSSDKDYLKTMVKKIDDFLKKELNLNLHPNKIYIRKYFQGIDFLGYIIFPNHILVRHKTKKRILKKVQTLFKDYANRNVTKEYLDSAFYSYLGVLSHANAFKLTQKLKNDYLLWVKQDCFLNK